jgi:hypothetical protein
MHPVRATLALQGAYYVSAGVVPFLSRRAFEAVTGPKREWWLVETVGALAVAVGASLLHGSRRPEPAPETLTLAVGSAVAFTGIDVVYVARGRIAPTYLLDAVAELGLLASLARSARRPPLSSAVPRP